MKKRIRNITIILLMFTAVLLIAYVVLDPSLSHKREIFSGVSLTVKELHTENIPSAKCITIDVHWDTPGVEIRNRPYSFEMDPEQETDWHYRLINADWARLSSGAEVLVNTTRYTPDFFLRSVPGMPIRSIETVVADGKLSHVHPHSYLMYMDEEGNGFQLTRKPPDDASLTAAVWGIGIQGVMVGNGKPRYSAIGNIDDIIPRTFIGMDPDKKILYLMAFELVDGRTMIDEAVRAGVIWGGQVDSGGGTSLIIGSGAEGVLPHTGIRGWRPLGSYLTIHAEHLKN